MLEVVVADVLEVAIALAIAIVRMYAFPLVETFV